ncbi:hypothetical protein AAMO2058_000396400 [Amorphochlora amoebiformis]
MRSSCCFSTPLREMLHNAMSQVVSRKLRRKGKCNTLNSRHFGFRFRIPRCVTESLYHDNMDVYDVKTQTENKVGCQRIVPRVVGRSKSPDHNPTTNQNLSFGIHVQRQGWEEARRKCYRG